MGASRAADRGWDDASRREVPFDPARLPGRKVEKAARGFVFREGEESIRRSLLAPDYASRRVGVAAAATKCRAHPIAVTNELRRMTTRLLLFALLFSVAAAAQQRLLQPGDLDARRAALEDLRPLAAGGPGLHATVALAAVAGARLPAGSQARADLQAALLRAHEQPDDERALARLRLDLGDLVDVLAFRPVEQADLPKGFPGFRALGELELRRYPAYRLARTRMGAGGSNGAFWPLFRHIQDNGIAMTAPVQTDYAASDGGAARPATMAFLYGDPATTPDEVSDRVEVVDVPAATVLSIGANGNERKDRIAALEQRLRAFVAASDGAWQVCGELRVMGYNSPMVRGERRYFEVQLPVRRAAVVR